ncbi:MAG: prolyl aminopeptidase, partial [Bdellovibrionales bacterium]
MKKNNLYPAIEPYSTGFLEVDNTHTLYWEQCGNPDGVPIIFLHGGPGSGSSPFHRRFFDPEHYRIILFDQRGAGRSSPHASLENNTRAHLVEDIEKLRHHLRIEKWHVFGGSWGSTLALSYAIEHTKNVKSLILRGIFLLEQPEVDWFLYGIKTIFPDVWHKFSAHVDHAPDLLNAYYERLTSQDKEIALKAGIAWSGYEGACASLLPRPAKDHHEDIDKADLATARMEAHYFKNEVIAPENSLLKQVHKLRKIPATIIQGRYD